MVISFLPTKVLRRIFPSWIAGLTVFLVGVTLVGVGIKVGLSCHDRTCVALLRTHHACLCPASSGALGWQVRVLVRISPCLGSGWLAAGKGLCKIAALHDGVPTNLCNAAGGVAVCTVHQACSLTESCIPMTIAGCLRWRCQATAFGVQALTQWGSAELGGRQRLH